MPVDEESAHRLRIATYWGSTLVTYALAATAGWARLLVPSPWGGFMAWTALALSGVAFARTGAALGGMTGQSYLIRRNLMRIIPTMHLDPTFAGDAQLLDVTRGAARCMVSDMLPKRIAFGVIGLAVLLVVGWVFLPSVALRLVMLISAGGSFGLTYFASFLSESGREVLGGFTDVFNPVSLIDAPHDR